jgi:hypothetical protein
VRVWTASAERLLRRKDTEGAWASTAGAGECSVCESSTMQFQKGDSRSCVHMLRTTGPGQRKAVPRGGLRRVAPSAERLLRRKNTEGSCAPTAGAGEQAVCEGRTMQFQIGDIISSVDVPRIMGTDHRKRVPGRVSRRV